MMVWVHLAKDRKETRKKNSCCFVQEISSSMVFSSILLQIIFLKFIFWSELFACHIGPTH